MRRQNRFLFGAALGVVVLGGTNIVMAQQVSSDLRGRLLGANSAPVSGAAVSLTDTNTGATQTTTTGTGGSFVFSGLAIGGPYTLRIDAAGYSPKTVKDIFLKLGQTANLRIALSEFTGEEVTVTGERSKAAAVAISESHGVATSFSAQEIANTPSVSRDIKDIVQNTPYAYVDPVGGGSSPPVPTLNIAGANPRCTNFLVDGLQQKDNFGLNLQGYPTARAPIPLDWADQIQVAVTPYDVRYNDTCGGVINVVTKTGSNDVHGSAYFYYKDDSLNGRDIGNTSPLKPPFTEKNWGVTLGGPIIEDKLFFFAGYDDITRTSSPGSSAVGPAGSGFTNIADGITQAQVDQIAAIAQNVYGFNAGNLGDQFTEHNMRYIGKLAWQIDNDNRLIFTLQHVTGGTLSINNGSASNSTPSVTLPSDWYLDAENMTATSLQYFGKLTDYLSVEAAAGQERVVGNQTPLDGVNFPMMYVRTPGLDGIAGNADDGYVVLGPDLYRHYNYLTYRNTFGKLIGTLTLGDHTITAGGEYHEIAIRNSFLPGYQSIIRFNSISDFQNGIIATTPDNRRNVNYNITNNSIYFANGANGLPSGADADFKFGISSFYIEDQFYPIEHLSVQAGLRYDRYNSGDHAADNPYFFARYGFSNSRNVDGLDALLPRLSFSYDWSPQQDDLPGSALTLRGGVGEYSGGFQTVWISNSYANTGIASLTTSGTPDGSGTCSSADPYGCVPTTYPFHNQAGWIADLTNGPLAQASVVQTSTVNAILPSFKLPTTLRANLGFDVFFGPGWLGDNWQFTFDWLHMNDYATPYWTNLRLQHAPGTAPDGRFLYEYKYDAAAGRPDPVTGKTLKGTDIGLGSVDGGTSSIFIVGLKNQWKDTGYGDFDLSLGYTHSSITDVSAATSSTASSSYKYIARTNFNDPEVGTSDYERVHRVTLSATVSEHFFGDLLTRLNLFGQRMSGQHYSLVYGNDPYMADGSTYTSGSLVYVPKVDPTTHMVTATSDPLVTYAPGFDLTGFNQMLKQSGLIGYAGHITPRNAFSGRWDTLINMNVEQELPTMFEGHHLTFIMDIFNLGNLLNKDWGRYTSPNFYQAYSAINAKIVGGQYQYTSFNTAADIQKNMSTQRDASTWQIQFGIRYDF
ncbi:MAG: TonB-dependent receptor [Alphaproteobacteria bacterium]|nr:TonB-dependent receptor [Alphaproteobacteria bacterium]